MARGRGVRLAPRRGGSGTPDGPGCFNGSQAAWPPLDTLRSCICGGGLIKPPPQWEGRRATRFSVGNPVVLLCHSCERRYTQYDVRQLCLAQTSIPDLARLGRLFEVPTVRLVGFLNDVGLPISGCMDDMMSRCYEHIRTQDALDMDADEDEASCLSLSECWRPDARSVERPELWRKD